MGPGGDVTGSRTVLPETAFIPQAFRVLRRADGTAFFLFLPDGAGSSVLSDPIGRVDLTYRRNMIAVDAQVPVYSQGGDTDNDETSLELVR